MKTDKIAQIALGVLITCFVLSMLSAPARPAPACLTKSEAREKYPDSHLYWATADRCWGDSSVRGKRHFRPRIKTDATAVYARETEKDAALFDKTPSTKSHKIIDLEAKLRDCCWPDLRAESDANGNFAEHPIVFADRIKDVPLLWWKHDDQ